MGQRVEIKLSLLEASIGVSEGGIIWFTVSSDKLRHNHIAW